jgi:hypothetical protein
MLLNCLVSPAIVVVRKVEFGAIGVAFEELPFGVFLTARSS